MFEGTISLKELACCYAYNNNCQMELLALKELSAELGAELGGEVEDLSFPFELFIVAQLSSYLKISAWSLREVSLVWKTVLGCSDSAIIFKVVKLINNK